MKVRKGKKSDDVVDEDDEVQHAPEPQVEDDEYNLQRGIQMSLESLQAHGHVPLSELAIRELVSGITRKLPDVEGKGKGIATDKQVALSLLDLQKTKEQSVKDQYIFQRRILMTHDVEADTEILSVGEENGEDVGIKSLLEVIAVKLVLLVQKLLLLVLKVKVAGIKVTTAERLQLLKG
ncbi:hypothetical protein Tco_1522485 [Tanacetum coccineum]